MQENEVTAAGAARLTGLSERTIRRKIAAKELPARQIARNRYAIRVGDLPGSAVHPVEVAKRVDLLEYQVELLERQMSWLLGTLQPSGANATSAAVVGTNGIDLASGSTIQAIPSSADVSAIGTLLTQLVREMQQLAPRQSDLDRG